MHKIAKAKIHKETAEGTYFIVLVPNESLTDHIKKFTDTNTIECEIRLNDGRHITPEQRKKIYAILADICFVTGDLIEPIKQILKYYFMSQTGNPKFSLSDCSVTVAREFITYLIDFCFDWDIPLTDTVINRTDDIDKALYSALKYKKCILCGKDGEIHHTDAIGIGRNRMSYNDDLHTKICLCRKHHTEAHTIGVRSFESKYHVYGIIYQQAGEEKNGGLGKTS